MVELQNVTKDFNTVRAVDDISFSAEQGQIFGLIGPNGAGKSTTIRMIMNIFLPDSGTILFDGRKIREEDKNRIGYLPEERGLYKKVKVNDILLYFAALKGKRADEVQGNIDRWLKRFDLDAWKNEPVEKLSKGMSQKVQFIAAVAHDPQLVFFDEPFSGLDPVSTDLLRESIQDLSSEGKSVLFSTHIMDQAERICNRIFLINKGKKVVYGTMDEVKRQHGKNSVIIEFEGDGEFIESLPMVARTIEFPRYMEIELTDPDKADALLAALVGRIRISRFEIVAPSLHKIFIDQVGPGEKNNE